MPETPSNTIARHALSFGLLHIIGRDAVEIIVNEGTDLTAQMIEELFALMRNEVRCPAFVLINKVHTYSYTYEAQCKLAEADCVRAAAVLTHQQGDAIVNNNISSIIMILDAPPPWKISVFDKREDALNWLDFIRNEAPATASP